MIKLSDIGISFAGHFLFEGVSLTLQKGERCGLIGRNGSGKSSLLRIMTGEMEADRGSVSIPKNYRIGYLEQHIRFTQPTLLEEAALGLPEDEKEMLYKAEKILFGLGFTEEDLAKPPELFSGGYHLRLHLAKVIISEPDCLLLDEPTNYLDIVSIRWLMDFLNEWPGEFILISHDRDFMDRVTTHTIGIHRSKVRKIKGSSLDFFGQILVEEEVHQKTLVKMEKKRAHMQSYIERFGAKASKASQAQSRAKMLARIPALEQLNALSELSFSFQEAPFPGRKMVEAKHLAFSYGPDPLIADFSAEVERGERIAIIGKNGYGKSTLLRLIAGELNPQTGLIEISENTRIGYFGQTNIDTLNKQHTIAQEISSANPLLNDTAVKSIAGTMMFSGDASLKKIGVLSGGEKSRVLLGKILAKRCNLLLLDEPTHHLDIESIEALIDALEEFSGTIVMVTHSELILRRLNLNKLVVCKQAHQSLFLGSYDEFLEKGGWDEEQKEAPPIKQKATAKKQPSGQKQLEKEIEECEKQIAVLEKLQAEAQSAFERGEHNPEFLKALSGRQKELDALYAKRDALYTNL